MEDVMVEKALLIASTVDGPWCPVIGLEEIEIDGLSDGDAVRIISEGLTLAELSSNGVHSVKLGEGKVMIQRISGDSRVTVRAFCTR